MANITKNGRAHVIEMANRASVQKLAGESLSGLTDRLDNHESGLNTNAHGISNIAGLQAELNSKEPVFSKNTGFNKNFGSTTGTVCEGNDSRLSDARTPVSHNHAISNVINLQAELDTKADIDYVNTELDTKADAFTGYTGTLTVIKTINFGAQTTTTATLNITNGIIVSIT